MLSKYKGEEHLNIPDDIKLSSLKEAYNEYDAKGRLLPKRENQSWAKSKYEEDVYRHGHTMVWGSLYHKDYGWAYKCCHSFEKNS